MSDNKHTPGPWQIDKNSLGGAPRIVGNSRRIAKVLYWMGSEDREVIYNANLIAAAPEMLEALGEMLFQFHTIELAEGVAVEKAKAAIKKATGE